MRKQYEDAMEMVCSECQARHGMSCYYCEEQCMVRTVWYNILDESDDNKEEKPLEELKEESKKMKNKEILNNVIEAVYRALDKYSASNVDVIRNEETNMLETVYHSRHNSFDIEDNIANYDDVDIEKLEIWLDECGVGYDW